MKTSYTKRHTNPKAAAAHIAKIKRRGGAVKKTVSRGVITVVSTYGPGKQKRLKM